MKKSTIFSSLLVLGCLPGFAQMSGSVDVEGEYVPIIIETERLNAFPMGSRFELPAANVEYDFKGIVTDYRPGILSMGVTGRLTDYPWQKRRGYLDFRLGSWLDSRLDAGVAAISDSRQTLSLSLGFESSSLYRIKDVPEGFTRPSRKSLYDGNFGVAYSRLMDGGGMLTAGVDYRLAYFNYYGTSVPLGADPTYEFKAPTQTVNQLKGSVGYTSSISFTRGWHAAAAVDYFAYRRGTRETTLNLAAGNNFAAGDNGAVAVDIDGDFIFLSHGEFDPYATPRNYGVVDIKPSYRLSVNGIKLQAGLNMGVSYDAMGTAPDKRFSNFHMAPDVTFSYAGSGVGISLSATGGVTPLTLAAREKFDRYQMPYALTSLPLYSPVDARLGITVGPFSGFQAEAGLRYAVARNTPAGGWYQALLGSPGLLFPPAALDPWRQGINLHGLGVDLDLRYSYGKMVVVEFNSSYTPQSGTRGIFNGYDRPRWTLSAKAGVRPIDPLLVEIGYDYRGVRNILYPQTDSQDPSQHSFAAYRLPDITDLNARISYRLKENFSIYCNAANLLNRHSDLLPGLPSEGIVVQGGLYVEF